MAAPEVAVVTGASSSLGEAIARDLLALGHTVVTLQRTPPQFSHAQLHFRTVDLSDLGATKAVAADVVAQFPVRYLVNNAGANRPAAIADASIDDLRHVTAVTLGAAMLLIQAFVPGMRAAGFGRIVSISSRAILGKIERIVYASAKAGLIGMTRSVAVEVGGDGVTVNAVVPGPVETALFTRGHPVGSAKRKTVIDSILVKRVGTPRDVSRAVLFFLDRECGYVTGQALFVCGGTSITGTGGA
ncbi:MAG: short-chain dehydrogenase [Betaproteobacteria bacterium RIFCSPLOWO2_02_FULL_63_19]|nr:MAG: short-chain dehydrogenase [Betaproteobacteria bacterium RIFCSPLOWO2_02_FULL_63_19]